MTEAVIRREILFALSESKLDQDQLMCKLTGPCSHADFDRELAALVAEGLVQRFGLRRGLPKFKLTAAGDAAVACAALEAGCDHD